jgi:hypothetical protein
LARAGGRRVRPAGPAASGSLDLWYTIDETTMTARQRNLAIAARLERYPLGALDRLGDGEVALFEGRSVAAAPLATPIYCRAGVAYYVTIAMHAEDPPGWQEVLDEQQVCEFAIEQDGVSAPVLAGSEAQIVARPKRDRNALYTPQEVVALLIGGGFHSGNWMWGSPDRKHIRWVEYVVPVEAPVLVLGQVAWVPMPPDGQPRAGSPYRDATKRIVLVPPSDGPMIIADRSKQETLRLLRQT